MKRSEIERGCERVRSRMDEWLDGGLSMLEEARDRGHLEACGDCRAALERREAWLAAMRVAGRPSELELALARRGLGERLALARAPHAHSPRASVLRRAWLGAAVAAAAIAAMVVYESQSDRRDSIAELFASAPSRQLDLELPMIDWSKDLPNWRSR